MLKSVAPDSGTSAPENSILDSTIEEVAAAIADKQAADGHWVYALEADATIPAEYILLNHYVDEVDPKTEGKLASQRTYMPGHSSRQSTPRSQSPSTTGAAPGHSRMPVTAPDGELSTERKKSANQKTSQNPNFVNFIEKNKQNACKHHRSKPAHDQREENMKAGKNKTKMQTN